VRNGPCHAAAPRVTDKTSDHVLRPFEWVVDSPALNRLPLGIEGVVTDFSDLVGAMLEEVMPDSAGPDSTVVCFRRSTDGLEDVRPLEQS
jgi:hypothetical protein